MKNIEKLAIIAIILYLVSTAVSRVGNFMMYNLSNAGWSPTAVTLLSIPYVIVVLAVNIAIAIWLYRVAKDDQANPWIWALFGFVFGVPGAILYFVYQIYETTKMSQIGERTESSFPVSPPDTSKGI